MEGRALSLSERPDSDQPFDPAALQEMLARHHIPPHTRWWQAATIDPIRKQAPQTRYLVISPDAGSRIEIWNEPHAATFDGCRYHLFGVEVAQPVPDAYHWLYQSQHLVWILRLHISRPDFPNLSAEFLNFPAEPRLPMLCGLSPEPSEAEWRCARRIWRVLMTFKQTRPRGRDITIDDVLAARRTLWEANKHSREPDEAEVAAQLGKHPRTVLRTIQDANYPNFGALPPVWAE
jgi:hypothetical protein